MTGKLFFKVAVSFCIFTSSCYPLSSTFGNVSLFSLSHSSGGAVESHCGFNSCFPEDASLIAQLVKNLPAMWETLVRFLGQEDLLEKG